MLIEIFSDETVKRQLESIKILGTANLSPENQAEVSKIMEYYLYLVAYLFSHRDKTIKAL